MRFLSFPGGRPTSGCLYYISDEYSFYFDSTEPVHTYWTVQVNCLQLEIDHTGLLLYACGYCPLIRYSECGTFPEEVSRERALRVHSRREPIPGIAYALGGPTDWEVSINKQEHWICLGNPSPEDEVEAIEFAAGCIAVIKDDQLRAIWLKPNNFQSDLLTML